MKPLLEVRNLSVSFGRRQRELKAVDELSLSLEAGDTLAIVGESGSGKSVTALSILRLIERDGGRITNGQILFSPGGQAIDLLQADEPELRRIRGNSISMVFQEPMTSLNPILPISKQLLEVVEWHQKVKPREARRIALSMLEKVRIPEPERRFQQFPHELSGGMRQRVMIAMALICKPKLLIADEPTTALDVTIQAEILNLLQQLTDETGAAILFITHDMAVVSEIANKVVVMRHGRQVEAATRTELFSSPRSDYTKQLIESAPRLGSGSPQVVDSVPELLQVSELVTCYATGNSFFNTSKKQVTAVNKVSFHINAGETLGLVGESGSGKSTIGRSILKLIEPTSGSIKFNGRELIGLPDVDMLPLRSDVQMVFQDPFASLNPRMKVLGAITEPLSIHKSLSKRERYQLAADLITRVGLSEESLSRYPHQFSGGQRQRICIARALSARPRLIIADEPVSALDVSVQAEVLTLFEELQNEFGIAYLFVSHDIAVIERMSHRVIVLYEGQIVEQGDTASVLMNPQQEYTKKLVSAVPKLVTNLPKQISDPMGREILENEIA